MDVVGNFSVCLNLIVQVTYYVVCPDIDPLTTAATDFFQQLGTGLFDPPKC